MPPLDLDYAWVRFEFSSYVRPGNEGLMTRATTSAEFAKVKVFMVDFDSSKDLLRQWKVTQQSTLIAFKGHAERLSSVDTQNRPVVDT